MRVAKRWTIAVSADELADDYIERYGLDGNRNGQQNVTTPLAAGETTKSSAYPAVGHRFRE